MIQFVYVPCLPDDDLYCFHFGSPSYLLIADFVSPVTPSTLPFVIAINSIHYTVLTPIDCESVMCEFRHDVSCIRESRDDGLRRGRRSYMFDDCVAPFWQDTCTSATNRKNCLVLSVLSAIGLSDGCMARGEIKYTER